MGELKLKSGVWCRAIALPALAGCAAVLSGCATPVPVRSQGPVVGNQGGAWEAVLPVARDQEPAIPLADLPEYARRDLALAPAAEPFRAADAWNESRPGLDNLRRVTLTAQADAVVYFRPPRARGR